MLDSVPPPLRDQAAPAAFLSCTTVAVRLTEFVPSTVVDDAVANKLIGAEEPPQLERVKVAKAVKKARQKSALILRPEKAGRFASTIPPNYGTVIWVATVGLRERTVNAQLRSNITMVILIIVFDVMHITTYKLEVLVSVCKCHEQVVTFINRNELVL
jgi:hypothetical protein